MLSLSNHHHHHHDQQSSSNRAKAITGLFHLFLGRPRFLLVIRMYSYCTLCVCVCVCVCVCELIAGYMQYGVGPIDNSLISTIFVVPLLPRIFPVTVHITWCSNRYDDERAYRITLFHELYTVTGNGDSSVIVVICGPEIGVRFATCGGWVNIQSSSGAHPNVKKVRTVHPWDGQGPWCVLVSFRYIYRVLVR